jgi:exosortase B
MSTTTLTTPKLDAAWKPIWPMFIGLCLLYLPTFYTFAKTVWTSEDQAHAPIILIVVFYIFWKKRDCLKSETLQKSNVLLGWLILVFGLFFYWLGRTQEIKVFEIGSLLPVLLGSLLITRGTSTIKTLWFPLLFLLLVIPLPGALIDAITGPLKQLISELVETILYWAGYPIARSGVTLSIGPYQLLVADACSGLNSMFSLSSMGLLYLYIMGYRSWARNGVLIASLIPIAFFANVLRVTILVLITYYFGDEVGQGFLHKFAGMLLFIVSMLTLFSLDALLGWVLPKFTKAKTK